MLYVNGLVKLVPSLIGEVLPIRENFEATWRSTASGR